MVGLLSGMDSESSSSSVTQSDSNVDDGQENTEAPMETPESQPAAENTDNVDEAENVKGLRSILKQKGQYTFRKVKVDFDLIPKKIPFNEDDYTVEIQIIEKEPVKIKSWAAVFAAKKAEAEAEAAAIAEAEEALKKAEEVQKREALMKANKAKLKKIENHSTSSVQSDSISSECELKAAINSANLQEKAVVLCERVQCTEAESNEYSNNASPTTGDEEETSGEQHAKEAKGTKGEPSSEEDTPEPTLPNLPLVDYKLAECFVEDLIATVSIPDVLIKDADVEQPAKEEDERSTREDLTAERSENQPNECTNDDLDDISTHEDASTSQLLDSNAEISTQEDASVSQLLDVNTEESLSQDITSSHETKSDLDEKSTEETSVSDITHVTEPTSQSEEDSSSRLLEMHGKKVPKKMLVTAESLVEEILSEMPKVIQSMPEIKNCLDESSPIQKKNKEEDVNDNEHLTKDAKFTKKENRDQASENSAQQKRRQYKKLTSSIYDHVIQSLERAAPEILETAQGVLEEIEKEVVEKVGIVAPGEGN